MLVFLSVVKPIASFSNTALKKSAGEIFMNIVICSMKTFQKKCSKNKLPITLHLNRHFLYYYRCMMLWYLRLHLSSTPKSFNEVNASLNVNGTFYRRIQWRMKSMQFRIYVMCERCAREIEIVDSKCSYMKNM